MATWHILGPFIETGLELVLEEKRIANPFLRKHFASDLGLIIWVVLFLLTSLLAL